MVSKLAWILKENKKFSKVSAKYFGGALKANLRFIAQFYAINFIKIIKKIVRYTDDFVI